MPTKFGSTRSWHSKASSRLLRHDFAVFPDVKWRAIHARGFARILRRTTQGASDTRSKAPGPTCLGSRLSLHEFFSRSCGVGPELSYTAQLSARGRYIRSKFSQLHENLRTTSRRGTSWPPCRTRAAIRRSARSPCWKKPIASSMRGNCARLRHVLSATLETCLSAQGTATETFIVHSRPRRRCGGSLGIRARPFLGPPPTASLTRGLQACAYRVP